MKKLVVSYILGILSFVMVPSGVLSLLLSLPGLVLAIMSVRDKESVVTIPIGYQGTVGKKKVTAKPFMTTKYLSFIAIGINVFSMASSLFATFILMVLFFGATRS